MRASDVMGRQIVTITPEKTIQEAATLMLSHGVSALPVVRPDGALLGIVSEGDLMRHADADTERQPSWWLRLLMGRDTLANIYVKEHSRRVEDVMTRKVVTAAPTTSTRDIAALLGRHRIKRVPIVADGKIVGIVSRADLIQMLASIPAADTHHSNDDRSLREKILQRIDQEDWARGSLINVSVSDGAVDLWGVVHSAAEQKALRVAAENIPGIRAVTDNTHIRPLDA